MQKGQSKFTRRLRVILRDNGITLRVLEDGRPIVTDNNPFGSNRPQIFKSFLACAEYYIPLLMDDRLTNLLAEVTV